MGPFIDANKHPFCRTENRRQSKPKQQCIFMNRLVIIGNGFDMAHGLKTSYKDFINWYWDQRIDSLTGNTSNVSKDCLCRLKIKDDTSFNSWNLFAFNNSYFKNFINNKKYPGYEVIQEIKNNPELFSIEYSPFFKTILQSIEIKGWVDIENDYYQLLKSCLDNKVLHNSIAELNKQLSFLQDKLVEYLKTLSTDNFREDLQNEICDEFVTADFSTEGKRKAMNNIRQNYPNGAQTAYNPKRIMLLSFNYTATARRYGNSDSKLNFIHGELEHPEYIIFGYGDELDKSYQDILDLNDNELLRNVKSVKYLETRRYRELLEFLMSAPFQVLIMGHSCGNSDRTLLNTVFEHENCVSIKPYYHIWDDGNDNYLDIVQNIYRNFTDKKLYRDRVVNKEQCRTM